MTDAQAGSQAHRDYLESRILSAHPVEIVHLLYEVAIENLNTAIACLKTGDNFARSHAVSKAQGAVDELMFALDHNAGAPFSRKLAGLYDFTRREISAGHTRRSEKAFRNALRVLTTLSEGWDGVKKRELSGAQVAYAAPDEPAEIRQERTVNPFYAEFPAMSETARNWSC